MHEFTYAKFANFSMTKHNTIVTSVTCNVFFPKYEVKISTQLLFRFIKSSFNFVLL